MRWERWGDCRPNVTGEENEGFLLAEEVRGGSTQGFLEEEEVSGEKHDGDASDVTSERARGKECGNLEGDDDDDEEEEEEVLLTVGGV